MFDITSSKLLLLGIVALLVIGPKDFPALMRTIGKYMGIIRGHAREFRTQFDEAMRESELSELKKQVETVAQETETSFKDSTRSVEESLESARRDIDSSVTTEPVAASLPIEHDANGLPIAPPEPIASPDTAAAQHEPAAPSGDAGQQVAEQPRSPEKSGA